MPSTSKKQHNFMAAVANNPAFAKKVGVSQSVGKDFNTADKGMKFRKGGILADINKQKTHHTDGGVPNYSLNKFAGLKRGGMAESKEMMKKEVSFMKGKGAPKSMVKHEEKEMKTEKFAAGGVTKAKSTPTGKQMGMLGMKSGGMAKGGMKEIIGPRTMSKDVEAGSNKLGKFGQSAVQKRGMTKGQEMGISGPTAPMQGMKKGGMTKMSKGGGIEAKGKTRGRVV